MGEELSFNDGVLVCKYVFQSIIEKTLNGVIEQEEIFYKAHDMLEQLEHKCDGKRLDELLHLLNMENVYAVV